MISSGSLGASAVRVDLRTLGRPGSGSLARHDDPAEGAGIAFDIGSHLIDQALQLFGPVTEVQAEFRVRARGVSEDDASFRLRHESGVRSHLTMSRVAALSGPRFRVLGTSDPMA